MFDLFSHYTVVLVSAAVVFALGVLLCTIHVPYAKEWRKFRWLRTLLVLSCFVLAAANFASSLLQREAEEPALLATMTIFIASYQALLFTYACITFIYPAYVKLRTILWQFALISVFGALLLISIHYFPHLFHIVFSISTVLYVVQLVSYTLIFRKEYKICVERLEAYYDEEENGRLRWVRNCFYSALVVGSFALVFAVVPVSILLYDCFVVAFTLYYIYMASCVVNYRAEAGFILQVMADEAKLKESEPDKNAAEMSVATTTSNTLNPNKAQLISELLNEWVSHKRYTVPDMSPDEVAKELGTSRRLLSSYFTNYVHTSFRTWRTKLRISEAERMLREEEEIPIAYLHAMVGISDKSNFYKQFRLTTGMTPSEYREKYKGEKFSTDTTLTA